jgi:hypothetical protein
VEKKMMEKNILFPYLLFLIPSQSARNYKSTPARDGLASSREKLQENPLIELP